MGNCFSTVQHYAGSYRQFMRCFGKTTNPKEYGESLKKRRKKKK